MKKLITLLILSIIYLNGAYAQAILQSSYEIKHSFDFYQFNRSKNELLNNSFTAVDIEGSPYLNENFIEGDIFTTSKTQFTKIPLRYNVYNDQVEFKNPDNQAYVIGTPETIEKIEFGEYQLEYIPFQVSNKTAHGFFIVVEKGEASLYARHRIVLEEAKKAAAYQEPKPARFISRPHEYYIRIGMESAVPVTRKKDLNNIFQGGNDKLNAFLRDNKIKAKDPESLKELVRFYNSL